MSGSLSKTSSNHEEIKKWVEERGGRPAKVKGTAGMLRLLFSDNKALEEITWEVFFVEFDKNKLALLYQDKTKEGQASRFFKFVKKA